MIVTVGARKGGTGKTTSAVALAVLLARHGPTVLVDADVQRSAGAWWDKAIADGWIWPESLTYVEWRDSMSLPPDGLTHAVIDTPPGDPNRLRAALRLSTHAVVPVGARGADVAQLGTTCADVEVTAAERPLTWGVLLTLVRLRTWEARDAPAAIEAAGLPLFDTIVPERADYARMFGTVPEHLGAYVDVLDELMGDDDGRA